MYSAIHCVSVVFSGENIICIIHNNQQCHAPAPAPGPAALPRMYSATVVRTWRSAVKRSIGSTTGCHGEGPY